MGTENVLRVQARITSASGLPEDVFVNTFHFLLAPSIDGTDPALWDNDFGEGLTPTEHAMNLVFDFYDTFKALIPGEAMADGLELRAYKLLDPTPRVPFISPRPAINWGAGSLAFPKEVALCVSYKSDLPGASGRGRIYVGPFAGSAGAFDSVRKDLKPSSTTIQVLKNAAVGLLDDQDIVRWAIFSPKLGNASAIVEGYIDDAFDTQRRRGADPNERTVFLPTAV